MRSARLLIYFISLPLLLVACSDPSDSAQCDGCQIGDFCYPEGVPNPDNGCEVCVSQASSTTWTDRDGAWCDDGLFCNGADTCQGGGCDLHAGDPCGGGLFCDETARQCGLECSGCLIEGVCLFNGEPNPINPCQVCDASSISTAFTDQDGTPCDDGVSCNGFDTCVDGACAAHTGNPCDPTQECWEEGGGQCCIQELVLGCDFAGAVVERDSCNRVVSTVMDCAANGSSCLEGRCLCDPVAGTGCPLGYRCTSAGTRTECFPDGTLGLGDACYAPVGGTDDCAAGLFCSGGNCLELCHSQPNTCPAAVPCLTHLLTVAFPDQTDLGVCFGCDPVAQSCNDPTQACYLQAATSEANCAIVPPGSVGVTQGDPCYGPTSGGCFVNGCDKGYGANMPDDTCAFFCNPIDNSLGNVQGLTGDPAGIRCDSQFGGARPDGPGAGYECRFIQTFYGNTELVPATVGMCVDPASAAGGGSCANFDLSGLQQDINDGITIDSAYCNANPDRCIWSCISLATQSAILP